MSVSWEEPSIQVLMRIDRCQVSTPSSSRRITHENESVIGVAREGSWYATPDVAL
jgi:hypothetical protein